MKKNVSRRDFLLKIAIGAGAVSLQQLIAACSPREIPKPSTVQTIKQTQTHTPSPTQPPTLQPTQAKQSNSEPTSQPPNAAASPTPAGAYMAVARGAEPEQLVRKAIAALGGMERFVKAGSSVIIKPNICIVRSYEYGATTNPWVVGTLVKMCLESGAKSVRVMDFPFGGPAEQAYVISGIGREVKAAGGEMVTMSRFKYVDTDIPDGKDLKTYKIYDDIINADVLINVPIAKHHSLARLTLGMKNLMGTVLDRPTLHGNLGQRIVDLTSRIRPTLTVVDAIRTLMQNGPTGGNLEDVKKRDTVIASTDIVAADSYAATLFGVKPMDISYIKLAAAMGLGNSDLSSLKIEEIAVGS